MKAANVLQALVERLNEWAKYVTNPPTSRQSLVQSIFTYRLDDSGETEDGKPVTARGKPTPMTASRPTPDNPRAEETERAVTQLRTSNPELGLVIVAEYLSLVPTARGGRRTWRTVGFDPRSGATGHQDALARALGIDGGTFRQRLRRAHAWLEGYFAGQGRHVA